MLSLVLALSSALPPRPADDLLALVPQPVSVQRTSGTFRLDAATRVLAEPGDVGARSAAAAFVITARPSTGFALAVADLAGEPPPDSIVFAHTGGDGALGPEGYTLEVSDAGAVVRSGGAAGLLHGAETLLQLFPPELFA